MKFRPLLLSLVLFALCAAPLSFAQDSGSSKPSDTPTTSAPDSTTPTSDKSDQDGKDKDKASDDTATKPPEPTVEPADPSKVKHDGGKDDVDAIGNRKVGGRGLGNWYSTESEIRMGKSYAQQVESGSRSSLIP